MPNIINEVKLDFKDVLLRPKRSTLKSRNDVDLYREITFRNSGQTYRGVPVMASNMDTVGTFEMAKELSKHGLFTCIHKYYSVDQWKKFAEENPTCLEQMAASSGTAEVDFERLSEILNSVKDLKFICLDVANGYSQHFVEYLRRVRAAFPTHTIIAGNVVTGEMVEELILSGADIIKVGIGPGSVCTTRIKTGVGYPQLSAVIECADAAHGLKGHIISTRALSPQYGESDAIRFLIGTQSLKPNTNQVHVVELEEDTGALHTKVFKHDIGEIWHLRCSPHDAATLITTHNAYDPDTCQCTMGVSIFKLPTTEVIPKDLDDLSAIQGRNAEDMELLKTITPEKPEEEIRCAEWHPSDSTRIGIVLDNYVSVRDVETGDQVTSVVPEGRARLKFTGGKWSPQGHCQFAVLQDTHIKCFDTRTDCAKSSWNIDNAHRQLARDIDFNPNRQFHLASAGDDAALNIWDYRNGKEPIFSRTDHSHWVWTVRYNTYHEQLLLTGSSDARALLTAAASICDLDDEGKRLSQVLEDGVLQSYEQHEDSVYCAEWSAAEPWTFASLSYDARLVLSRVPRHFKYKILL